MNVFEINQSKRPSREMLSSKLSDVPSHRGSNARPSRGLDPRQIRSAEALRAALLQLLEHRKFEQITIKEICETAGVHNATFFRHHADKEALLDDVAKDEINRLVAFSLPAGQSLDGWRALSEYVDLHRSLWTALLTGGASETMRAELMRVSRSLATEFSRSKSWLPSELSIICTTTLLVETVAWWLTTEHGQYSVEEIATILDELIGAAVTRSRGEQANA